MDTSGGSTGVPHIVVDKIIDCKVTEEVITFIF